MEVVDAACMILRGDSLLRYQTDFLWSKQV